MTERIWKGNEKLEPWLVEIGKLNQNPQNARRHKQAGILALANSFDTHGQQAPIVIDDNQVVRAGNGRLLAVKHLGWTHIAAIPSDISDHQQLDLYGLADNRTSELSYWDEDQLTVLLKELSEKFSITDTGLWKDHELGPLMSQDWTPPAAEEAGRQDSPPTEEGVPMAEPIALTLEQREIIGQAIKKLRDMEDDQGIREGRALELICGDFLA